MRKLLLVCLISVSSPAFAAEPITYDGREGVFFEAEAAKKVLQITETDYPAAKREVELLQTQIEQQKQLQTLTEQKQAVDQEIAERWKTAYEQAVASSEHEREKSNMFEWIAIGVFVGGTLTGAGIMYLASLVLANIEQSPEAR